MASHPRATPRRVAAAVEHLRRRDPVMRALIRRVGPCRLAPDGDGFRVLVWVILSQQLSAKAAGTIRGRLEALVGPSGVAPTSVARLDAAQLRSVGVSGNKARAILELARGVLDGDVNLEDLDGWSDDEVIEALTRLRGIGLWSVENFLIFALGRLDIFPIGDAGLRATIGKLYFGGRKPSPEELEGLRAKWRPYATIACWYLWENLDTQRKDG